MSHRVIEIVVNIKSKMEELGAYAKEVIERCLFNSKKQFCSREYGSTQCLKQDCLGTEVACIAEIEWFNKLALTGRLKIIHINYHGWSM